ncbi:MAG: hypothetical protein UHD05_06415 [Ruminococcus sp.]|nr:hypothetical protein [Ruminococcus sp.]
MKKEYFQPEFDFVKLTLSSDLLTESLPTPTEDPVETGGVDVGGVDPGVRD